MKIIFFFFCFLEMHEKEKDLNIIVHQMYACFSLTATVLINLSKTFSLTCRSTTMHSGRGRERERSTTIHVIPLPNKQETRVEKKIISSKCKTFTNLNHTASTSNLPLCTWMINIKKGRHPFHKFI